MRQKADPLRIIGECYAEKALIKHLLKIDRCTKVQGKTLVITKLSHLDYAIGIIDNDKDIGNNNEIQKFSEIITDANDKYFILKKEPTKNRYLIILKPDLEKWIHNLCVLSEIKMEDYHFESGFVGLKKKSKKMDFENNHDFKQLINALIDRQNPEILRLQKWLTNFNESFGENIL